MNQHQRPRGSALTWAIALPVGFLGGGYFGLLLNNSYAAVIAMIVICAVIVNIGKRRRMARAAAPAGEVPTAPQGYVEYGFADDPRYQE